MSMKRWISGAMAACSVTARASARVTDPRRPPQMITTLNGVDTFCTMRAAESSGITPKTISARATRGRHRDHEVDEVVEGEGLQKIRQIGRASGREGVCQYV